MCVYECVFYIPTQFSSAGFSFLLSSKKSSKRKHMYVMLKLSPNTLIMLGKKSYFQKKCFKKNDCTTQEKHSSDSI